MQGVEAKLRAAFGYLPKDFVETATGHFFALLAWGLEGGRAMASLRYVRDPAGRMMKQSTAAAIQEVARYQPRWDYDCPRRDVRLQAVKHEDIHSLHRPVAIWPHLLAGSETSQAFAGLSELLDLPAEGDVGVTGSHLLGASRQASDIDLVAYGLRRFEDCRRRIADGLASGSVQPLSQSQWRDAYQRRGCEIDYDVYLWHERRKLNKFSIAGIKVDLSCVDAPPEAIRGSSQKLGELSLQARVVDDRLAFATPAVYVVEHPQVESIVCFTPTYAGQARVGELVEARGWVEQEAECGSCRLVIGTSREAETQYLKVVGES